MPITLSAMGCESHAIGQYNGMDIDSAIAHFTEVCKGVGYSVEDVKVHPTKAGARVSLPGSMLQENSSKLYAILEELNAVGDIHADPPNDYYFEVYEDKSSGYRCIGRYSD